MIIGRKAWCDSWQIFGILAFWPNQNPDKIDDEGAKACPNPDIAAAAADFFLRNA